MSPVGNTEALPIPAVAERDAAASDGQAFCGVCMRDVSLTYPCGVKALRDVSLAIQPGEHVAILGPSGSGKSTLLKCLSGSLTPSQGLLEKPGRVAVIHQDLRLVKQRTALQNVLDGALARTSLLRTLSTGPTAAERDRATALLKRVGLENRLHHRVSRLSGGEQQRVAIARALMQDPAMLLADEPVASLDQINAKQIMGLITELAHEHRLTVVSVLHDPFLAQQYADRLIGLDRGQVTEARIEATGPNLHVVEAGTETTSNGLPGAAPAEPERPAWFKPLGFAGAALAAAVLYFWSVSSLDINTRQMQDAGPNMLAFLQSLLPSSWAAVAELPWSSLFASLVETLQMSLIGTTVGVLFAIPLAAMAAENIGPLWLRVPMRFTLNIIRTVPSLIWALLFVAAVGVGSFAGILALVFYSIGYLTKFFYEAFEGVDPGPQSALKEMGAGGAQRFLNAVWPAARPAFLSSSLFMLEYNVRAASVLGIVGAGGIGFYLMMFAEYRNFTAVLACLVMLLVVVQAMDTVSKRLRAWLVQD